MVGHLKILGNPSHNSASEFTDIIIDRREGGTKTERGGDMIHKATCSSQKTYRSMHSVHDIIILCVSGI